MNLPYFRFHPDPISTGSIEASASTCIVCGEAHGFIYVGPVFGDADLDHLDDSICPWCIGNGAAHERYTVEFSDPTSIGGGIWDTPSPDVVAEIAFRTPGFNGWQQERWFAHCGDAAALVAIAGWKELTALGNQAVEAIAVESGYAGTDLEDYLRSLDRQSGPTAYVFRCLRCGQFGGYSDCH
jgi:uncharacterized protein